MSDFKVCQRDSFHWDIQANGERAFTIRGEPRKIRVNDERSDIAHCAKANCSELFEDVQSAINFCVSQLINDGKRK